MARDDAGDVASEATRARATVRDPARVSHDAPSPIEPISRARESNREISRRAPIETRCARGPRRKIAA